MDFSLKHGILSFFLMCVSVKQHQLVVGITLDPELLACLAYSLCSKDTVMKYLGRNRAEVNFRAVNLGDLFCFKHIPQ